MSVLLKALTKVKNRITGNRLFNDQEVVDLVKERNMLLKHASTPAPMVESLDMLDEADIRLPRIPVNQRMFYLMRWQSVILRMICLKLKQEIFRETMKEGFDWEPAFKAKCEACGKELRESTKQCIYCQSTNLVLPDPSQKLLWDKWILNVNLADQTFLEICSELEDDLNTVDDLFLICIKEYLVSNDGELIGKIKEIMRGDPATFRIVSDRTGRRGGKYWVCATHRDHVQAAPGQCSYEDPKTHQVCSLKLHDVHYVETEAGGKNPLKFYIKGEVIHTSKYEPSRLYGISPIYTLWIVSRTLQLMDRYAENLYEKGRLKGVLAIATDNVTETRKWWDETEGRLRKDPHYVPMVTIDPGDKGRGGIEFVKLMNSLQEMQASEYKKELRMNIAALYGISPIFQADLSTGGGLQNEGLQITVTDRAVEMGQSIYHNKIFPKLTAMLGITDWKPKLKPSREMDEMAELQRKDLMVTTAEKMINLGFEAKLEDEKFVFTGEAGRKEERSPQMPSGAPPKLLPARTSQGQPEPDNRQGVKPCPPGMQATPENPRCHPIEWDTDKQKALVKEVQKSIRQREMKLYLENLDPKSEEAQVAKGAGPDPSAGSINAGKRLKVFDMERQNDESGISGTGLVASGIVFPDGKVVLRWNTETASTTEFDTYEDFVDIHIKPHGGNHTKLHFYDLDEGDVKEFQKSRMPSKFISNINSNGRSLDSYNQLSRSGRHDLKVKLWNDYGESWFNFPAGKQKQLIGFMAKDLLKADLKKSGDMLAHFACIGNKLKKAGIKPPFTRGKAFKDWWDKEKATNPKAKAINEACNKAGNIGESDPDYPDPYPPGYNKAAVESGRAVDEETQKIENRFLHTMEKTLTSDLVNKIKELVGKGVLSKIALLKLITDLLSKATPKMEKQAFGEILRAYQEGKGMVSEDGKLEKVAADDKAPRFAISEILDFTKGDQQVLRAIFDENPFWESFANMSKSTSEKLQEIITESYEPVNTSRMKATVRDVLAEAKKKGKSITKAHAEVIAYGRIGKFNLAKTIEMMKRTINAEVYRLERIARSETTAITAKGREIAMVERDEKNEFLFKWFGPLDHRTSDVCKEIGKRVAVAGKGNGVPLAELKDIMKSVTNELNPKWGFRDWLPHANCRRVLMRAG